MLHSELTASGRFPSLHCWFNSGGTDVLLRKEAHGSLSALVCRHMLHVRKVHRRDEWGALIQRTLCREISKCLIKMPQH